MNDLLESCKRIFDSCPRAFGVGHVHVGDDGNPVDVTIEYLNDAMAATAECTPDDLRGKRVYEVWFDGDRTWLDCFYRAAWLDEPVEFNTVAPTYSIFQNVVMTPLMEGYCLFEVVPEDIDSIKATEVCSVRRSDVIESLSAENYALYLVDLSSDLIEPYILRNEVAEYFAKVIGRGMPYSEWLKMYCDRYVIDTDSQNVAAQLDREAIISWMADGTEDISVSCRRLYSGEEQYVELRITKLPSEANEVVLSARNINEEVMNQIRQKEALQTALTLAEHASEAKSTFLTNISHDFRTPLNSIMGFANIALSHLEETERVQSCLEKIIVSSEHLLDLINDILDVSRIESGKIILSEQPIDLEGFMEDIHNVFYGQASEKGIELTIDASEIEHPLVLGDSLRMNQILVNTVGNALKYTDSGGKVEVAVREGGMAPAGFAMYEMVVRDTGCGMSEDFIERIFMPFERDSSGSASATEGTGLGMTITKNLVDLLGGTIDVKSVVGRGSEFIITLPLKIDRKSQRSMGDLSVEPDEPIGTFDGFRVLVTDDDELSRELMTEILRDRGFDVEQATDGDEALDMVEDSSEGYYDALIMDMRMPRMSGDVASLAIRALPRQDVKKLPIIAVTADAFEEGHRRAKEAGMTAHITKPLNINELLVALREHLLSEDSA